MHTGACLSFKWDFPCSYVLKWVLLLVFAGWPQAAAHLKNIKRKSIYNCHKKLPNIIFTLSCLSTFQLLSARLSWHSFSLPLCEFMNPPSLHPLLSLLQPHVPSDLHDAPAALPLLCLSVSLWDDTTGVTWCCQHQTVMKNLQGCKTLFGPFPRSCL